MTLGRPRKWKAEKKAALAPASTELDLQVPRFNVGAAALECRYCGFLKYLHERNIASRCCGTGQYLPDAQELEELKEWEEEVAQLFRGSSTSPSVKNRVGGFD